MVSSISGNVFFATYIELYFNKLTPDIWILIGFVVLRLPFSVLVSFKFI